MGDVTEVDDEFSELVDADLPRADLVGKGANGVPFLVAKSDGAGLVSPELVRDLLARAEPEPVVKERDDVTISGSPGAVMKMIHEAAVRGTAKGLKSVQAAGERGAGGLNVLRTAASEEVAKKDFTTAERKHAAATGAAMPDGSYEIDNVSQLDDAVHAVGRGDASHDAIRKHIISRAKSLGASSKVPDDWNADGSLKEGTVSKQQDVTKADVVEADEPLPDADEVAADENLGTADGDPDDPASPAWEQVDAVRAQQAIELTIALRRLVCQAQDRESQEASVGADSEDAGNVMDLAGVLDAVDCILGILAPFAVCEEAEADERQAERDALVGKGALVAKAGRVLSTVNEQRVRNASGLLQEVLASLPAPITDDGAAVAKEEAGMAETETVAEPVAEQDVTKANESLEGATDALTSAVEKAKGDPQVAVYTADGKLVGTVDQSDLNPIAAPAAPEGGDAQGGDGTDSGDGTAPVTDESELQAAPADQAGVPADAGAAAPADAAPADAAPAAPAEDDSVAKSADEVLKAMIDEKVKAAVEGVVAEHAAVVKSLEDQIADLAAPAPARVLANGQLPPAHQMRGQDAGSEQIDVTKAEGLRDELNATTDVGKREAIQKAMNENAAAALAALHAQRR